MKPMVRTHICTRKSCRPMNARLIAIGYKPDGLWYQVNDDWENWLTRENYRPVAYRYKFALDLADANILKIRSMAALTRFNGEFAAAHPVLAKLSSELAGRLDYINWPAVQEQYDGVEIAPYQWGARFKYLWYYGWDVASGVIWRPRGATLTRIPFKP